MNTAVEDAVWQTTTKGSHDDLACVPSCVSNNSFMITCDDRGVAVMIISQLNIFGDSNCTLSQSPVGQRWVITATFDHVRDATQAQNKIKLLPALKNKSFAVSKSLNSFHTAVTITISLGLPLTPEALFFHLAEYGEIIYYSFETSSDGNAVCLFAGTKVAHKFWKNVLQVGASLLRTTTKLISHNEVCKLIIEKPFGNFQRSLYTKTAIEGHKVSPDFWGPSEDIPACSYGSQLCMSGHQGSLSLQSSSMASSLAFIESSSTASLLHQTSHNLLSPPSTCENNASPTFFEYDLTPSSPKPLGDRPQVILQEPTGAQGYSPVNSDKYSSSCLISTVTPKIYGNTYSTSIAGNRNPAKASPLMDQDLAGNIRSAKASPVVVQDSAGNKISAKASLVAGQDWASNAREKRTTQYKNPRSTPANPDDKEFSVDSLKKRNKDFLTVMVRNIPNKLSYENLKAFIDKTHPRTYDFLYLRMDWETGNNAGYAFMNFITPESLISFAETHRGNLWPNMQSHKRLDVAWARIQGKESLIRKFVNSSVMSMPANFRPHAFVSNGPDVGTEEEFAKFEE